MTDIIGWDIGGAHLKAAHLNAQRQIVNVYQQPCPLWKGLNQLENATRLILKTLPEAQHVITMTGELVDFFDHRDQGVAAILNTMQPLLTTQLSVFAGSNGILPIEQISQSHYEAIASANWLASASFAAQTLKNALFVDIGSTTTDILLLQQGNVCIQGYSDYQRLKSQELVYTGIIRTPVMAIAQTVLDEGEPIGLMAEYFATMADVYRLTGELNKNHDQTDTADGGEKTMFASARRLARMLGCDFYADELTHWQKIAKQLRQQQLEKIVQACQQRLILAETSNLPVIGAGVGQFLVKDVAQVLGCEYLDFATLCPNVLGKFDLSPADCAPAVAVACLLLV